MSGFISAAVTRLLPAARATSTSEPSAGADDEGLGLFGRDLEGKRPIPLAHARPMLSIRPSQDKMFVQASESM